MSGRVLLYAVIASLVGVLVLVFAYPQAMISSGALMKGHAELAADCFACHAPLRGSSSGKCIACHPVERIGLFTTAGRPINQAKAKTPFHQNLTEQNCTACHAEHRGADGALANRRFSHALLQPAVRDRCQSCHTKPADSLHRPMIAGCGQCHSQEKWRPATFDHARFFVLDGDHNAACTTCHGGGDFKTYGCYGCHEHSPGSVRAEHMEEGIGNFENCVECHRSADEHEEGRGESERD